VNDARPADVARRVSDSVQAGAVVACLGLAFKADIDDLRETPSVEVVRLLGEARPDLTILAVEPHVERLPEALESQAGVSLVSVEAALDKSECVVLLVDHADFRALDPSSLTGHVVVDTRGLWRHLT
jgi:UDP-N-acetyl-D-mannosaminuronic acid dehydrogenase